MQVEDRGGPVELVAGKQALQEPDSTKHFFHCPHMSAFVVQRKVQLHVLISILGNARHGCPSRAMKGETTCLCT